MSLSHWVTPEVGMAVSLGVGAMVDGTEQMSQSSLQKRGGWRQKRWQLGQKGLCTGTHAPPRAGD